MALRLFPLLAYLAAVAYLISWLIRQGGAIFLRVRAWRLQRRVLYSMRAWIKPSESKDGLFYLAGALLGGVTVFWLVQVFIREWLLVIVVGLAILSEEMRISSKEIRLLEVMVFFNRLATHIEGTHDLFEALAKVVQELPEGSGRKAVREAILRRRSGESFEGSLKAMRGMDPLMDELILTVQLSGWQSGPGLNIVLNQLLVRAGRRWDRASRRQSIKDRCRAYVQFSRGAFVAALSVILFSTSSALNLVMPDRVAIGLAFLALFGLGFVFYFFLARQWLRRSLAVSIFIVATIAYANTLTVPIPAWIQVETISHQSDISRDTSMVTFQISTQNQELPPSFLPASLNMPPVSGNFILTSAPAPTAVATVILNRPVLISTSVIPQEFDLCCPRSRHPR